MKTKVEAAAAVLAVGAFAAGCGGAGISTAPSSPPSSTSAAGSAPRTIQKAVGASAAYGCTGSSPDSCMTRFVVTAVENVNPSACGAGSQKGDTRLVRVSLDVQGMKPREYPNENLNPGHEVTSENWYALGADGYTTKAEVATWCPGYKPGPFYDPVAVGQKARGDIVFAVPASAHRIQVRTYDGRAWEWPLP
ncbi:hypothetical protein GCM10027289_19910 [Tsukamurella serpentis]